MRCGKGKKREKERERKEKGEKLLRCKKLLDMHYRDDGKSKKEKK